MSAFQPTPRRLSPVDEASCRVHIEARDGRWWVVLEGGAPFSHHPTRDDAENARRLLLRHIRGL